MGALSAVLAARDRTIAQPEADARAGLSDIALEGGALSESRSERLADALQALGFIAIGSTEGALERGEHFRPGIVLKNGPGTERGVLEAIVERFNASSETKWEAKWGKVRGDECAMLRPRTNCSIFTISKDELDRLQSSMDELAHELWRYATEDGLMNGLLRK